MNTHCLHFPGRKFRLLLLAISLFLAALFPPPIAAQGPGEVDLSFNAGSSINREVETIVHQPDGKLLIGGWFLAVNDHVRGRVARLHPDGSTDSSFMNGLEGANGAVYAIAVQEDGKILIAGRFTAVNGVPRNRLARLNTDGSLDPSFDDLLLEGLDSQRQIRAIAVQGDGKILLGLRTFVEVETSEVVVRLNSDGTLDDNFILTMAGPGTPSVSSIVPQGDGTILIGGGFNSINGETGHAMARLNADGSLDQFLGDGLKSGAGGVASIAMTGDGKIVVGGGFTKDIGWARNRIARLNADGTLDDSFADGLDGANDRINALAVQSDGKIVIGGIFSAVNGETRNKIARLNSDGSLDHSFGGNGVPGYDENAVSAVATQPDGKVIIGGDFRVVDGNARNFLARLHTDGTVDMSFPNAPPGPNGTVVAIAEQTDGKILIGGSFTSIQDEPRNRIARLMADGILDGNFGQNSTGANGTVSTIAVQDDGRILIGGAFTEFTGQTANRIARLNLDGTLDTTFANGLSGANDFVSAILIQANDKILIAGRFSTINGEPRPGLARLNLDGTLDPTFSNEFEPMVAWSIAQQSDGRLLIRYSSTPTQVARLHADGSVDTSFANPLVEEGLWPTILAFAVQPDDKILIGGRFDKVNGVTRRRIARLNADGTFDSAFEQVPGMEGFAEVQAIALHVDGKIIIGGQRLGIPNGQSLQALARLNSDGTVNADFFDNFSEVRAILGGNVQEILVLKDDRFLIAGNFQWINRTARTNIARLHGAPSASVENGYLSWAEENLPPGERAETDDSGGYGIFNLLRYAFDMNASAPEREKLPQLGERIVTFEGTSSRHLTLTYTRRIDDEQIAYIVEESEDLVSWLQLSPVEEIVSTGNAHTELATAIDPKSMDDHERRFLRLIVGR